MRLKTEFDSPPSSKSSLIDLSTGRVKSKVMKYDLDELFDNTPVFDVPLMNFKDGQKPNFWNFIANKVLFSEDKLPRQIKLRRKNNDKYGYLKVCS